MSEAVTANEAEMRESKVPTPESAQELAAYVDGLLAMEHDYGTCVHAMSMAAVAALHLVAHKLGVTGFQASCAEMDILRRVRGLEWGQIVNYANLLYPQYCDDEHFPSARALMGKHRVELAKRARRNLAENGAACESVLNHWKYLAAWATDAECAEAK